jgi:hypothetical protein
MPGVAQCVLRNVAHAAAAAAIAGVLQRPLAHPSSIVQRRGAARQL